MASRRAAKAWSGRLGDRTAATVEEFTTSIAVDRRLYDEDLRGSAAHARMLRRSGLLSAAELRAVESGLTRIRQELESGGFAFDAGDEDIHMAVERRLGELIGDAAGRLHTARSRNDQVATDLRLWVRGACAELMTGTAALQEALLGRAREHRTTLMPGYTHLQRAQVISLAHHLLAYVEMLGRDGGRLRDCALRSDVLPLGSGALAGTTLPIDRESVAADLGFAQVSANSVDAVADRDFAVELCGACALLMVHLSRLAEEIVLWTSAEFAFASLPDSHATGSSLMPQKKNPDVLELVRGRSARVIGDQVTLLTTLKALPLAYNRDLQEDKQPLFDAVDTTRSCLGIVAEVIEVIRFDEAAMAAAAADPGLIATDVADLLVEAGIPFREAHRLVGAAVRRAEATGRSLADLSAADWSRIDPRIGAGVVGLFDPAAALRRHDLPGGPGPRSVGRQLSRGAAAAAATRREAAAISAGGARPAPRPRRKASG